MIPIRPFARAVLRPFAATLVLLAAGCSDRGAPVTEKITSELLGSNSLAPSADTYVLALTPNQNYGSQKILVVNEGFIQFDQVALAALVPAGAVVSSARLQVTLDAALTIPLKAGSTLGAFRMTHPWTETGATFDCAVDTNTGNTKADCSGTTAWNLSSSGSLPWVSTATATAPVATGQTGALSFDVTSDVQGFVKGTFANSGWIIRSDALGSALIVALGSRESTKSPVLTITVSCGSGFADCDHNPANGCEQPLNTTGNCRGCGISCDDGNPCTADSCDAVAGCRHTPVANGTACNDGNACTQTDSCQAGVCTGGNLVVCAATNQCHAPGVCNPASGVCTNPVLTDGTACNDGNACTQTDACMAGVCTGANPVVCAAADQCHLAGVCNPMSGVCSNPTVADGTICSDGNPCTLTDACLAGVCTGTNPVICAAADQCHAVGFCNSASGTCSNPALPDGTACNDGNTCTQTDACMSGVCTGANPVVCTAQDSCHLAGTCDAATGSCSNPFKNPGMACWVAQGTPARTTITGGPWTLGQGPASNANPTNGFPAPNPGTFNFQPYYFPFTVGDNVVMQGLFDYRPKNLEEAVVSARSTDGGQSWLFEDKVMDFNPNPVPNSNNGTDDGQGHPFVMNVGGTLYLYTIDRTPGVADSGGLTIHVLSPTARHPLAGLPPSETPPSVVTLRTSGLFNPDGILAVVPGTTSPRQVIYLQKPGAGATNADYTTLLRLATTSDGITFTDLGTVTGLTDANSIWVGPRGTLLPYTDGRYGLFFSAGISADGDADAFHYVGYAESTDLLHWNVLQGLGNPLLSIDPATDSTHGPQVWYAGRVYDPSVTLSADGATGTLMFAGYNTASPKDNFGDYRQIGRIVVRNLGDGAKTIASDPPLFPSTDVNGIACASNDQCVSGFCVDGVCCDTACGGGVADCQACSLAAGAGADGTCGPLVCQAVDSCHEAGSCDPGAGACTNPAAPQGTACGPIGGGFCDGAGSCVGCLAVADCPGSDTACQARTCIGGVCGVDFQPAGTLVATQTPGDCHENACDGAGNVVSVTDDTDVPVDGQQCTSDVCSGGVPSNPPLAAGTPCTDHGGSVCGAKGGCIIPQTFFVVRVGDGVAALSSGANPVFVEEQTLDGTVVRTIPLPTTASGSNHRLTDSGKANSDGMLALSGDGHYVTLAGYDAAIGTASLTGTTSAAVPRVVGRINAAGAVDTTTTLTTTFSANNVRGAVTNDGTRFWVSGANGGSNAGIQTVALGGTVGATVTSNVANARAVEIVGGNLYASSAKGTFTNVFQIGSGLPTTSTPAAALSGMPTAGASPYQFVLLDLDPTVAGVDTMYVADDGTGGTVPGGIQKWTKSSGGNWTEVANFTRTGATGFQGVAGVVNGSNVWLLAGTAEGNGSNNLVVFVDSGSGPPASFPANSADGSTKVFRGLSLPPN